MVKLDQEKLLQWELLTFIISINKTQESYQEFWKIFLIINNNYYDKISAEKIFVLLIIPGLDMFRLFITRINNRKNPFSADRNHLHHLLLNNNKNYNYKYLIYFLILIIPSILSAIEITKSAYLIIILTILYFIIVKKLKIKNFFC